MKETMKVTKILAAKCLVKNDHNPASFSPWSTRICTKSSSIGSFAVRMVQFCSNNTCSSISLSKLRSSVLSPNQLTYCLPPKSQGGLTMDSTENTGSSKSVHVKFQIKLECQFGDHILMVGDDPLLGAWSPLNAIPFNWSEGHLWYLVLEMPIEKSFKYKFLHKKSSGEILWQPGPDRIFTSWGTKNVIIVSEDWATAEAQEISEQQQIVDESEEVMSKTLEDDRLHIVAENITDSASDENITVNRHRTGLNVEGGAHLKDDQSSIATKKAVKSLDRSSQKKRLTRKCGHGILGEERSSSSEAEDSLITNDEGPVLVPGLTVMLMDSEKDRVNEHQKSTLPIDSKKNPANEYHKPIPADSELRFETYKNQEYVYRFD